MDKQPLLVVKDLKKYFPVKQGLLQKKVACIKAVDGVSFEIFKGKTLGLVGESGSGKTTLARSVIRLVEPDEAEIFFEGRNLIGIPQGKLRLLRKDLQIIFQDPFNSLDPRFNVSEIIQEGLINFTSNGGRKKIEQLSKDILNLVGLPEDSLGRFPHEFSGGQRQRISIARSLVLDPKLLILDEPVSSLDVSVQAQIINLLLELQDKLKLSYLFISHDLNVVRAISDRISVMYLGKIIEEADSSQLFKDPLHPYTRLLVNFSGGKLAFPEEKTFFDNQGCVFKERCSFKKEVCKQPPPFFSPGPNRRVACWLFQNTDDHR
ncbi:MAG: ABC transporter ATP-binding protein [Candidatus Omnitrophica bacterium]|nr:ABC transporter ATP-binding protein [Candidatus Omnitrophota bacterium]